MEESDRQHGPSNAARLEELTHKKTTHANPQLVYKPGTVGSRLLKTAGIDPLHWPQLLDRGGQTLSQ